MSPTDHVDISLVVSTKTVVTARWLGERVLSCPLFADKIVRNTRYSVRNAAKR
jgi:hypothetical protein